MKNFLLPLTILLVAIFAFSIVSSASAEELTPYYPGNGNGYGGNGHGAGGQGGNGNSGNGRGPTNRGNAGTPLQQNINLDGQLDPYYTAYMAQALGIAPDELAARLAAGESFVSLGLLLGFDQDALFEMQTAAKTNAINQAVLDGLLSQEEADWLLSRLEMGRYGGGIGSADQTCLTGDCTFTQQQGPDHGFRGGQ
jgi:hypothetical protein